MIQNIQAKAKLEYPDLTTPHICVGRPVNYECTAEHEQDDCNALAVGRMDR